MIISLLLFLKKTYLGIYFQIYWISDIVRTRNVIYVSKKFLDSGYNTITSLTLSDETSNFETKEELVRTIARFPNLTKLCVDGIDLMTDDTLLALSQG